MRSSWSCIPAFGICSGLISRELELAGMPTGHRPFPGPWRGTDSTEQIRGKFGRVSQLFRLQRDVLSWEGAADMKGSSKHLTLPETPPAVAAMCPGYSTCDWNFGCSWVPV